MNPNAPLIQLPTRAMASLLAEAAPAELAELRQRFAGHAALFDTFYTMGEADSPTEDASVLLALRALAEKTLQVSQPAVDRIVVTLGARGRKARQLRLTGAIFALVSGASVLATPGTLGTLGNIHEWIKLATGVAALVGSTAVLVGEHLEKPVFGSAKALGDLVNEAMLVDASIRGLTLRLLSDDRSHRGAMLDLARKTNEVAAKVKELSVFGEVPIGL